MNFYLDFEATQFSERIISIGCVADNGNEFNTLVKPPKGDKVNQFITDLTGITQEMVENADCADLCFLALREFIRSESNGEETFFFVYGNADSHFVERTVSKMIDPEAKRFARKLGASLIDFSLITNRFFGMSGISLKNAVSYFRQEEIHQTHRAIDDAELLRELVYMVNYYDMPETTVSFKKTKKNIGSKNSSDANKSSEVEPTKLTFPEGYDNWCKVPREYYPSGTILRCDRAGNVERPYITLNQVISYVRSKHTGQSIKSATKLINEAIDCKKVAFGKRWVVV